MKNKSEKIEQENKILKNKVYKLESKGKHIKNTSNVGHINNTSNVGHINNTSNVSHINTNNTINNINVKVLAFKNEDLSHLTDATYLKILDRGFKSVQNLVEYIHFNKTKPENNNMYISNMRDKHIIVFDGEDWQLRHREDILKDLIDDKTAMLSCKFDELEEKISEPTKRKFERFIDNSDGNETISNMKNDLQLILYNNRKMPQKNHKKTTPQILI